MHVGDDGAGLHIAVSAVVVAPNEHQLRLPVRRRIRHLHADMQHTVLGQVQFVIVIGVPRLAQIVVEIHRVCLGRVVGIRNNTL